MRNLKLEFCRQLASSVAGAKFLLLDPNASRKDGESVYIATESKLCEVHSGTGSVRDITEAPGLVGAEYLALNMEICLATEVGEVLTVDPSTGAVTECTFCDDGLHSMTWSPDQEVAIFVTKSFTVVVMTCTFDVIAEHVLAEQCSDEGQFMNVGWGKKETQFHGSDGKTAARQVNDFRAPTNVDELPQNVEVTWRADGAYFAVSFVSADVGRMFKVFDKEGNLFYISERVSDLQPPIAWRPSGTWIAMPQLFPNKSTVSLFEKNGLRHREIVLPFDLKAEPIQSLRWSSNSDVLSIETRNTETEQQNLYLYTIGNYHWYLKQVLRFDAADPIALYSWDQHIGEEKTLHISLQSGKYLLYRWRFDIDRYARSGVTAVIDGKKLLLTDFSKAVVPPPMCSRELLLDEYINACTIYADDSGKLQLCLHDANGQLQFFKATPEQPLNFEKMPMLPEKNYQHQLPLQLGNLFWLNERFVVASTSACGKSKVFLFECDFDAGTYSCTATLPLNDDVVCVCNGGAELRQFFVQLGDHRIQQIALTPANVLKLERTYAHLEQSAEQMQWFSSSNSETTCLITLLHNQRLFIDEQQLAGDVTSFCLAGNYLAYTKLTSLHFVLLSNRQLVYTRNMERGGKLVTTIANDARIVLQMPRGNLEAISPRVLALEIVGELLNALRYYDAFDMLRKQRINLNIICDHDMLKFMQNLDTFLKAITNPHWLNLFLSELQNEDFTQTMYASNYAAGAQRYPDDFNIGNKVAYLCEKLCERMSQSGEARFRLPIITTHVKMGQLEQALLLIWQEKKKQTTLAADAAGSATTAEDALKYLLYLVDVNELYNVALGTYDFGLVLYVAQRSQKDPKEFLPFLNELKALELNYRKFKIDEHLKRYEKALQHIAQCSATQFEEVLSFVKRHGLYQQALKYYTPSVVDAPGQACYEKLCLAFADELRASGAVENASIMYERGGNLTQALLSAKHVLDWQRVLMLARKDAQDVAATALSLIGALEEHGQHEVAYQLLKTYGDSTAEALQCLLRGKLFLKAIFEAQMSATAESVEELIKPELLTFCNVLQTSFVDDEKLFISYKQRLLDVREKGKQKQADLLNGDERYVADEADLLSDTTSMHSSRYTASSRGTGKTFRSSKNRRKHERKMLSLKPGNPFEDIALIDALYNQITKVVKQQQQVRDTCKALLQLHQDDVAAALQQQFSHLLALMQDSLDEIWTPELAMQTAQQQLQPNPNCDYTQLQNEQRYAMLTPQKRFKPQLNLIDWKHEILC